ncbi:glycoside hydrolase family 3 protein [Blastococcus sp. CT_GayMR20]|uniref:glycoside hydrolase family 3 N-terminal domain-containing protein n=1 Tax=Blastococcus sp. CT_GayMR20 TaxID=2559609 RepID=UPI001072F6B8|nr:glycoside hydrolase family 3 N-terminal domain-containing protein [Blastococcus sp. CT_GayMR20]TFV73290.1 glycoside hydrolase family 3 protein [Blastococcus sp. CT_GayMR20]
MRRTASAALLCLLLAACSSGGGTAPAVSSTATGTTPSVSAEPTLSPEEEQVDAALELLDDRGRVQQLFVVGVRLDDLSPGDALAADGIGGIFLAGRSEAPATELAGTTAHWQSLAPGPGLWVAADQEGGAVQTLKGPGFTRFPTALEQGGLPPAELSALAGTLGAELAAAGVNLDLAPVADVVPAGTEDGNAPVGAFGRQYGSTAGQVTAAAGAVVDGLAASDVTATLKHFPGLGRVEGNTDTDAGVTDTVTTAGDEQVAAFGTLARSPSRPFVMVSSATYTQLDAAGPATFSRAVLSDLLRDRLGFDGVVVTDDVGHAEALRDVAPGDRAVRFLEAGGTLVLTVDAGIVPGMVDAVLARSAADPAFAAVLEDAVTTALTAKARAGLLG